MISLYRRSTFQNPDISVLPAFSSPLEIAWTYDSFGTSECERRNPTPKIRNFQHFRVPGTPESGI